MSYGRMLHSLSPQERLVVYRNCIVRAVGLLILAGARPAGPLRERHRRLQLQRMMFTASGLNALKPFSER